MSKLMYKFTFEDGTEALAHYGVKGMKWDKHVMAQDPAYLESLGMAVPGGAEFNPLNAVQEAAGQAVENAKNTASNIANEAKAVGDYIMPQTGKRPWKPGEKERLIVNVKGFSPQDKAEAGRKLRQLRDNGRDESRAPKSIRALQSVGDSVGKAVDSAGKAVGDVGHNLSMKMQTLTHPKTVIRSTTNMLGKEYHSYREQMPNGRRRSWNEVKKPQTFEEFKEKVRKEEAKSPVNKLRNLLGNAGKAVDNAGKAASKAVSDAGKAASKAVDDTITKHGTRSTTTDSNGTSHVETRLGPLVKRETWKSASGNNDRVSSVSGRLVDGEYQREKSYNSRRNEFKSTSHNASSPSNRKQRGHFTVKDGRTVYVRY